MEFQDVIWKIKSDYGVNQTMLARHIGVSPQILTDIKAGRRRFTHAMAESIMSLFAQTTDAGWLAAALQSILAGNTGVGIRENNDAGAMTATNIATAGVRIPVFDALCKADSQMTAGSAGRSALIPESLAPFVDGESFPYVLILDCDDYAGRLRAGDQVLIVQNTNIIREIMVIESNGRMRLARNAAYLNGAAPTDAKEEWLALDTGKSIEGAAFVGAAVGIVAAIL